ncbi:hypothetical protein [Yersinia enterocolitica]|uniref:hypothetical protein n=1 Tax=Yersinia enterocolitica TaxID=630 RepID=UPI0028A41C4A|nr:hypothetical protein [Yersinia enterocolitica]ELI6451058.1 hypothetical protein [Yersinia ruckeri]EKN6115401.1 hypothetical protein [Yersinia enterocolitica]ELI8224327.1 hypothetical protein [Yersinia enterocolitica]ELI8789741.1 hypothetical protein [Yersinia enterocolitica]
MKSIKKSLTTPIAPNIINNYRSYWATHFYSLLKCIDQHKQLQYSPQGFATFPIWSLSTFRGNLPPNFFDKIEDYIKNWGIQYFLTSFFNQKMGSNVVDAIIERLEQLYNVKFSKQLDYYSFYVSGIDSSLSNKLKERFSEVFPNQLNGENPSLTQLINYSDLCLVLENSQTGNKVGIFGEVEGIKGNKLRSELYWGRKQNFCIFGIGAIDGQDKKIYIEENHYNNIPRVQILIEKSNPIISDFMTVINYMKWLFLYGPSSNLTVLDEELGYFINKIKINWATPMPQLFRDLENYIDKGDLLGFNDTGIELLTDIQSS